jgi:hypothetical protein
LPTMIDEVLINAGKMFGSAVAPEPIQGHLNKASSFPGRRKAPGPESRC